MAQSAQQVPEIVLTPTSRPKGFSWGGFSLRAYLDLLRALVSSQIKVRYKYTTIGLGWAVLNPILLMLVYAYVFGTVFGADRANYRLFLLAGLLPWQAFSSAVAASVRSIVVGNDLLKKAPFPSELLPLAAVVTAMINFLIVFVVYVIYLAIRGFPVLPGLPWIIVALIIQTILLAGLSLLLGSLNVFFRDIEQFTGFAVWIGFFLTPIIYQLARLSPERAKLLLFLNPMAPVVTTIQTALLKDQAPPLDPLLSAGVISLGVLGLGWWVFRRLQYELPKVV